jgi:1-deoxy-D-xylulose 5-phosphate reductoisomerase
MDIPAAVEQTLQQDWRRPAASLEDTLELDRRARSAAEGVLKKITNRIRTG